MNSAASSRVAPLRDFSDRLSPMVVKELRHGLRTRFFTSALILFHWLLIMLLGSTMVGVSTEQVNELFWILSLIAMLGAVPIRGFTALASELDSNTLDMLTLTSISSFRIVWGKWTALFSQSLLLMCSLLPYIVARYQFGGVEILREIIGLIFLLLGSALATAAFVGFSSQTTRLVRGMLVVALSAGLLPLGVFVNVFVNESGGDSMLRSFLALPIWQMALFVIGFLGVTTYGVYFFLALGASMIAPPSENHSTVKRLVSFTALLSLLMLGLFLTTAVSSDAGFWAFAPLMILTLLNGMDLLTESLPKLPTVVLPIVKQKKLPTRLLGSFLYPGWCSGVFLYLVLAVMPMTLLTVMTGVRRGSFDDEFFSVMACFLIAPLVPVCVRVNRKDYFVNWWAVTMIQVGLGILMAVFCGATGSRDLAGIGMFTPITTLFGAAIGSSRSSGVLGAGVGISLIWAGAAIALAIREWPRIRELEAEAELMLLREKNAASPAPSPLSS
ncbi:MAG: hypothetical protein K1X78_24170 [Verrucomicrobiaceae bacterium]|nr:hypothetical protein [Verrucomicrobiaceae bacterium]